MRRAGDRIRGEAVDEVLSVYEEAWYNAYADAAGDDCNCHITWGNRAATEVYVCFECCLKIDDFKLIDPVVRAAFALGGFEGAWETLRSREPAPLTVPLCELARVA